MHSKEETETAVLQREWLLHQVMPPMLKRLQAQLETSLGILSTQEKTDALPLSTAQNDFIKGFLTLSGCYINKAELQIKLPNYHQETPVKATVGSATPYFLEQAQQGKNYIAMATKRLQAFTTPFSKQAAVELLVDLYQYIDCAHLAFDYPNEAALFPYKVCHPKYFSPPLKQDLVIEFCVHDVYIVCNVFALDYARHNPGKENQPHVTYKDKSAIVVDEARTQTQSPMLTELKSSLKLTRELCQAFKQMLLQIEA